MPSVSYLAVGPLNVQGIQLWNMGRLGGGAFGTVHKVRDEQGNEFALKEIVCGDQHQFDSSQREIYALLRAQHPRIVQIKTVEVKFLPSYNIWSFLIVEELCHGGDLNSRLEDFSSPQENLKWIYQVAEGVEFIHSLNPPIIHRDLKPDNLMLTHTSDLKIGDFGLARDFWASRNMDGSFQSPHLYYMSSCVGMRHSTAPEVFRRSYTEKADVFSLGCIFHAISTRDHISLGRKKLYGAFFDLTIPPYQKVGLGYAMAFDPNAVQHFRSSYPETNPMMQLIKRMLDCNPRVRPSAFEVKQVVGNISQNSNQSVNFPQNGGNNHLFTHLFIPPTPAPIPQWSLQPPHVPIPRGPATLQWPVFQQAG